MVGSVTCCLSVLLTIFLDDFCWHASRQWELMVQGTQKRKEKKNGQNRYCFDTMLETRQEIQIQEEYYRLIIKSTKYIDTRGALYIALKN